MVVHFITRQNDIGPTCNTAHMQQMMYFIQAGCSFTSLKSSSILFELFVDMFTECRQVDN